MRLAKEEKLLASFFTRQCPYYIYCLFFINCLFFIFLFVLFSLIFHKAVPYYIYCIKVNTKSTFENFRGWFLFYFLFLFFTFENFRICTSNTRAAEVLTLYIETVCQLTLYIYIKSSFCTNNKRRRERTFYNNT